MAKPKESNRASTHDVELPKEIVESFAQFLVSEIRKFYESEQGQKEFAEWETKQKQSANTAEK